MGQTFTCEYCGKTYVKGWTDEETRAEYKRNLPGTQGDEEELMCDDCYDIIVQWWKRRKKQ